MFYLKNILLFFVFTHFLVVDIWSENESKSCLQELERELCCELIKLNIPPKTWVRPVTIEGSQQVLDVAIIGGGMAGQTVAFALMKEGITNIKVFDENCQGREGPWEKYARMRCLRSGKALSGPALDVPSLTCRSWFEASFGASAWKNTGTLPTKLWSEYLQWYRKVLKIPVQNNSTIMSIVPKDEGFELVFDEEGKRNVAYCRKVVLATGREGFGGKAIPAYLNFLSKRFYCHSNEEIDAEFLSGKKITVVGAGASAFDAVAFALENGADRVDMLIRRQEIPSVNKFSQFSFPGMLHGYYHLSDDRRSHLFAEGFACGTPPTKEALDRVKGYDQLFFHLGTEVQSLEVAGEEVVLCTTKGKIATDFIIAATGFAVDGYLRSELQEHMSYIQLWDDKIRDEDCRRVPIIGHFPYLGNHFQFLEKEPGTASYLKSIYCFNYGAFLSHGLISGEIPGISFGASRLAKGIAADFFCEDCEYYQSKIETYAIPMYSKEDLP